MRVFFCGRNGDYAMAKNINIYCPRCNRKVSQWDGRSSINVESECKKCRKRVLFDVTTFCTEIRDIPPRACSSGKTFY